MNVTFEAILTSKPIGAHEKGILNGRVQNQVCENFITQCACPSGLGGGLSGKSDSVNQLYIN